MSYDFLQKEKKRVFREYYRQYLDDGYSHKEAKHYASIDSEDFMSQNEEFIEDIMDASFDGKE